MSVHILTGDAREREKDNFLKGARKLAVATRNPSAGRGRGHPHGGTDGAGLRGPRGRGGTMVDVTILGWGVRETVTFFRRLCRAVGQLHGNGLVHGCLRPANVLLDDDLNPRLTDVGMVIIDDSYDGPSDMKHDYAAYAAREVRHGRKADVRSDIFSLGRCCTSPFTGKSPTSPTRTRPCWRPSSTPRRGWCASSADAPFAHLKGGTTR